MVSRRRFIAISAAAGVCAYAGAARATTVAPYRWRGRALGAEARLLLHHPDRREAARIIADVVAEIERLENIFSLYRGHSAISRLNRQGRIDHPPFELVQALADCRNISELTHGAFDVTVQPLWRLYADHFSAPDPDPAGPTPDQISHVRRLVDYREISIDPAQISLSRPGMALTLNGFAQGYITDRIADLLRAEGLGHVLVDIGETRALDDHPDGRSWRVGIRQPNSADGIARRLALVDQAVATSGGYGQRFGPDGGQDGEQDGGHHHLFDPQTGRSAGRYASVSVVAPQAATADALSTAFSNMSVVEARDCLGRTNATAAYFLDHDGGFVDIA